jgi:hypothetical protein
MVVPGRVQNGVVVLPTNICLPEGQEVTVIAPIPANSDTHSVLDIPPVSVGQVLKLPARDDDINQRASHG